MIGVISDIHGNLPALEAVLAELRHMDRIICLGDVVNYGPWSDECLELLWDLPGMVMVQGNHEALFLGEEDWAHEIPLVQQFFQTTFPRFRRFDLIRNLPREQSAADFLFTHTFEGRKIYPNTPFDPPCDAFIGHSHAPFQRAGSHRLINPGSVGQNRASLREACYALLDEATGIVTLHQLTYPVDLLLQEMRARAYPPECIEYYVKKL